MNVRAFTTKDIPPKGAWVLAEAAFRAKCHEYGLLYRATCAVTACSARQRDGRTRGCPLARPRVTPWRDLDLLRQEGDQRRLRADRKSVV